MLMEMNTVGQGQIDKLSTGIMKGSHVKCKKKNKTSGNKFRKYHSKCRISAHKMQKELSQNTEDDMDFFGEQPQRPFVSTNIFKQEEMTTTAKEIYKNVEKHDFVASHAKKKTKNNKKTKRFGEFTSANTMNKCKIIEDDSLILPVRVDSKPHKWPVSKTLVNKRETMVKHSESFKAEDNYNANLEAIPQSDCKEKPLVTGHQDNFSLLDKILSESTTLQKNDNSHYAMGLRKPSNKSKCDRNTSPFTDSKETDCLKTKLPKEVSECQSQVQDAMNSTSKGHQENQEKLIKFFENTEDKQEIKPLLSICCGEKNNEFENAFNFKLQNEHLNKENLDIDLEHNRLTDLHESETSSDDLVISLDSQIECEDKDRNSNHIANQKQASKRIRRYSNENTLNCCPEERNFKFNTNVENAEILPEDLTLNEIKGQLDNHQCNISQADDYSNSCRTPEQEKISSCDKSSHHKDALCSIQPSAVTFIPKSKTNQHIGNIDDREKEASLLDLVTHANQDTSIEWQDQMQAENKSVSKRGGKKKKARKRNKADMKTRKDSQSSVDFKKPKVQCKYFKDGKCRMGAECNFLHEGKPERRQLCKYYATDCCLLGGDCIFMHSDFPCKFHHAYSNCMNGNDCKYSHEPLNDETRELLQQALSRDDAKDSQDNGRENDITADDANDVITQDRCAADNLIDKALPGLYEPLHWS